MDRWLTKYRTISVPYLAELLFVFAFYKVMETVLVFENGFLPSYFEDLLALPILLGISLFLMRLLAFKLETFRLSIIQIVFTFLLVSVVFEIYLPSRSGAYIRDFYDIICYAVGTIFFSFCMNQKPKPA